MLQISTNMINFSDLSFIFRFLPIFLLVYYLVPAGYRAYITIIGSLLFYAVGDFKSLGLFCALIVINYLFSIKVKEHKKILLVLIVLLDVSVLMFYKLMVQMGKFPSLPLGISFFMFKMISYQADMYKGKMKEMPRFSEVLLYFSLFPQVISGPIMRYQDMKKNRIMTGMEDRFLIFRDRLPIYLGKIEEGLAIFVMGLAMKVLIADRLSMMWNDIGTIGYESISTPLAWAGVLCFSLELYFDFWGYSLMASAVCVMMGYPFIINFDQPYASKSVSEFYRRWHMTLGSWFKDYVYIPLGGSRNGDLRCALNLFVVWLLTGIWHGISLNFFLWSGSLLLMIYFEKFLWSKNDKLMAIVGRIHVLLFLPVTWVIFALTSSNDLCAYLLRLFPVKGPGIAVNPGDFGKIAGNYRYILAAGVILLIPQIFKYIYDHRRNWFVRLFLMILFWICAVVVSGKAGNPFLYFGF